MNVFDTITELLTLSKWENIIEQTKVTALVLTNYPRVIYLRGQYSTVPKNGPALVQPQHLVLRQQPLRSRRPHPAGFQLQGLPIPSINEHEGGDEEHSGAGAVSSHLQDLHQASVQQGGS